MTGYIINTARAISETIDSETIIINLDTGNYYSMNESATLLWQQLATAQTADTLIAYFLSIYTEQASIKKSVADILDFLLKEQLILETPDAVVTVPPSTATKKEFIAPKIEKYDDMQEMLLADPIHDVDDSGWPKLK
jgi:hypothetical protein